MSDWIHVVLTLASPDDIVLSATVNERSVETSAPHPRGITELVAQIRDGEGTRGAVRALGAMLGDVLFAGPMLGALRGLMGAQGEQSAAEAPALVMCLELDEALAALPWELTADPETGELFISQDRELIRVAGAPPATSALQNTGLVVASATEAYRLSALKAAATQLRRRFMTSIEAIKSVAELEARGDDERPLLCHIYAADRRGCLSLDGSTQHISELGVSQRAHLLNISPCLSADHAFKAREAGASVVINRQIELPMKASAESDRALYHSFGSGLSAVKALTEARSALRRATSGYDWASLTLTLPPPAVKGEWASSVGFEPFPPPLVSDSASHTGHGPAAKPLPRGDELQVIASPAPLAPITQATPGARFVADTVKLVQETQRGGREEDRVDLALRTGVMKQLSAIAKRRGALTITEKGLTRSEVLTQQLIGATRFDDEPLKPSSQWYGYAESLARELGLRVEGVAQAVRALLVSRSIWLYGADPNTRRKLARALCDVIYQSYPYEVNGGLPIAPLELSDQGDGARNGALWESASLGWAPRAAQPLDATRRRPSSRARVTAYHAEADAWRLYDRLWLVVDQADRCDFGERYRVSQALSEGALRGVTESGAQACCYLPLDHRVIYLSDHPAIGSTGEVQIGLRFEPAAAAQAWVQRVREQLQACEVPSELVERRLNHPLVLSLSYLLSLMLDLELITLDAAAESLSYATLAGGELAHIEEAIELYLHPTLSELSEGEERCVRAYALRDQESFDISWRELMGEQAQAPELPLADLPL